MMAEQIGVIGLGNIGNGVAKSLASAQKWTVHVWDLSDSKRQALSAFKNIVITSPKAMADQVSVILFVVPSTKEIRESLAGEEGIFANAKKGLVIYDLTTSYPDDSRLLCEESKKFGISYLDAGTSGGPYKADTGQLLTMVGGVREKFDQTREVLDSICEHVFYVGESGTGHTLKLLHNIVCHATTLATAEAGHIAESAGIPLGAMIEVFNVSNARSYASEFRFPKHIVSQKWDGRSRIFNLHKDITMGKMLGQSLGADTTYTSATLDIIKKAMAFGMEEEDYTLLYRDFDKIRGASFDP